MFLPPPGGLCLSTVCAEPSSKIPLVHRTRCNRPSVFPAPVSAFALLTRVRLCLASPSLSDMPEDVLLLICSDETMSIGRMGGACLALLASTCQYYRRLKLPGGSGLSLVEEASKDLVLRWHCPLQPKAMLAHRFANEWRWTQTLSWFGSGEWRTASKQESRDPSRSL